METKKFEPKQFEPKRFEPERFEYTGFRPTKLNRDDHKRMRETAAWIRNHMPKWLFNWLRSHIKEEWLE